MCRPLRAERLAGWQQAPNKPTPKQSCDANKHGPVEAPPTMTHFLHKRQCGHGGTRHS